MDELRLDALGSTCHLMGAGLHQGTLHRAGAWITAMHHRFSRFRADSEVWRLNAAAPRWVGVSVEMAALLLAALRAYELSGGLVHAGVLGPMLAAGYVRPLAEGPVPTPASRARPLLPLPCVLEVDGTRARLRAGYGIDLGGIAKGWMADALAAQLGDNCLVNLGGDLYARGEGPSGKGWPVGFGGITVSLRDRGAATSGVVRRCWLQDGELRHHLIDPRTGRPAMTGVAQVSAVAATALEAEVLAKTGLLLGPDAGPAYLAAHSQGWWLQPWAGEGAA